MKKKIAKMWVKALRSGDYEQGHHGIRDAYDRLDVLGVLCNLHAIAHPDIAKMQHFSCSYLDEDIFLPRKVRLWAGMSSSTGAIKGKGNLALLNDMGYNLEQLADIIEQNWEKL